jgi:ribosomal protein S18 acetylase RimI-like enzyme
MPGTAQLQIVFAQDPPAAARQTVERGVDQHNVGVTNEPDYYPFSFILQDVAGEVLGGVLGDIWAGWLHVSFLWVARPLRGRGWARRLMAEAERYGRLRGAHDAYLETFSFQARPLYEKLGYRVFGQLENFPVGHTKYFLRKPLGTRTTDEHRKKNHR